MTQPNQTYKQAQRILRERPPSLITTMLAAAVLAGASIPSATLAEMGISIPFDWRKLNRFQAAFPIPLTHNEDGQRLPKLPPARHTPIVEADDDF